MWLFLASITVKLSAGAGDGVYLHHIRLDAEVGAFLVWAVAHILVLDCVIYADLSSVQLA